MSKEYYRYAISILAFKDNVLMVEATSEKDAKKKAKKFINIIADKDRGDGFEIEAKRVGKVVYRKEKD